MTIIKALNQLKPGTELYRCIIQHIQRVDNKDKIIEEWIDPHPGGQFKISPFTWAYIKLAKGGYVLMVIERSTVHESELLNNSKMNHVEIKLNN